MTPYEIRLELLKLAYDVLMNNTSFEIQHKDNNWQAQRDYAEKNNQAPPEYPATKSITTGDIMQEAVRLNTFVSSGK